MYVRTRALEGRRFCTSRSVSVTTQIPSSNCVEIGLERILLTLFEPSRTNVVGFPNLAFLPAPLLVRKQLAVRLEFRQLSHRNNSLLDKKEKHCHEGTLFWVSFLPVYSKEIISTFSSTVVLILCLVNEGGGINAIYTNQAYFELHKEQLVQVMFHLPQVVEPLPCSSAPFH